MDHWNRCDECGQFIPYDDFDLGLAWRQMVTPSTYYTEEEWETFCKRHNHFTRPPLEKP